MPRRHVAITTTILLVLLAAGSGHQFWQTSAWSECQISKEACRHRSRPHDNVPVFGHKKRQVWCSSHDPKGDLCPPESRPQSTAVCFAHCSTFGCGQWSPWSPWQCDQCLGRQRRHLQCDDQVIEEQRACFSPALCTSEEVISLTAISQSPPLRPPEALTSSFVPYLHVSSWSDCQPQPQHRRSKRSQWSPELPADLEISFVAESVPAPKYGVQKRDVQCRGQDGESLPFRVCVDGQSQTVVPSKVRSCVISQPCQTSAWTEWSLEEATPCPQSGRYVSQLSRRRRIEKLPQGNTEQGETCPHLVEHKPSLVHQQTNSTCKPKYVLRASGWSSCRVVDLNGNVAICGGGLQERNISCLQNQGQQPVDKSLCANLPQLPRLQRCFVPCTDTCTLGAWTEWSHCIPKDCSASGGPLDSHLPGRQTRHRIPLQSSPSCPHLEESRDCSISSCYSWRLENRDECFLPRGRECGTGTRKILFACVDYDGNPAPVEACSFLDQPPYEETCHIHCPSECILSSWTAWTSCPSSCTTSRLSSRSRNSLRNRTVLALGDSPDLKECGELYQLRPCPVTSSCDTYHWRAGLWGVCRVLNQTKQCGPGIRRREAVCVMYNIVSEVVGRVVPQWRCRGIELPSLEESCSKPCPQDCQMTQWSDWSSCDDCSNEASNWPSLATTSTASTFTVIMNTQSRYRRVLQWPENGGLDCPRLLDVRPCPLQSSQSCQSRSWRPQPWSKCILPESKNCGEGIQVRGLDCLSAGSHVDLKHCLEDVALMERSAPVQHQRCVKDCVSECVMGPWSPWTSCTTGCPSRRIRSRLLNSVAECASNSMTEEEPCTCQKHRSVPSGPWSDCLVTASSCGIGKRYRRLHCLDMENRLAEPTMCGNQTYEEEPCSIPCPVDCQMSSWSDWGLCDSVCGFGLKNRTSKVVRLASIGGRPCPGPTVQYALCNYPCQNFFWLASPWSECVIEDGQKCGRGRKTRTIRCVERTLEKETGLGVEMDVPSHYCDPEEKPQDSRDCQIHCPGQCVVSEWTEWTSCYSDDCLEKGFQGRNRSLLRTASSSGLKCAQHLKENRPCDSSCFFRYEWHLTAWSSCQPVGDSSCGEGKRRRGARCIRRNDGRTVKDSLCQAKAKPAELETWCPIDCPVDCEVSEWSPWDLSPCKCGIAALNMTRARVVTTPASPSGRPCPPIMEERKPCPSRPCYAVRSSEVTCDLQGAACGHGIVRRNLTCLRQGESSIINPPEDINRCSSNELFGNEEKCFQPCPTDCLLSDWSAWSECQGSCVGSRTRGLSTRSRSVIRQAVKPHGQCLSDLVERRSCSLDPCYSFSASVVDDKVVCIRSDGLLVEDLYCVSANKPRQPFYDASGYDCQPPCKVLHSECNSLDQKCHCKHGYIPTYLPAPILSSRPPTLVFCQSLSSVVSGAASKNISMSDPSVLVSDHNGTVVPMSYFPDDSKLNPWMLAMIGIGCVFIAFVGVSIYLMCKSTNQEVVRVPKD